MKGNYIIHLIIFTSLVFVFSPVVLSADLVEEEQLIYQLSDNEEFEYAPR